MFKTGQSIRLIIFEDADRKCIWQVFEMSMLLTSGKRDRCSLDMLLQKGYEAKEKGLYPQIEFVVY